MHPLSRREMLARSTLGFGSLALASLLADDGLLAGGAVKPSPRAMAKGSKP